MWQAVLCMGCDIDERRYFQKIQVGCCKTEPDVLSLRYRNKRESFREEDLIHTSDDREVTKIRIPSYTTSKQIGKLIKFYRNTETNLPVDGGPHAVRR